MEFVRIVNQNPQFPLGALIIWKRDNSLNLVDNMAYACVFSFLNLKTMLKLRPGTVILHVAEVTVRRFCDLSVYGIDGTRFFRFEVYDEFNGVRSNPYYLDFHEDSLIVK